MTSNPNRADDALPHLPSSFLEEIRDLTGDVLEDYGQSILTIDPDVHAYYRRLTLDLLRSGRDINLIIDDVATGFVWMLLLGREHALRGLPAPVPREDAHAADLIRDQDISDLIDEVNGA